MPNGVNAADLTIQTASAGTVNLVDQASASSTMSFWNGGSAGDGSIAGGSGTWNANTIWTDASATSSGQIGASAFAVFQGTAGTVTVDTSAGPVTIGGMQFVTGGYVVTGGPLTLTAAQTNVRVGDGTTAGGGGDGDDRLGPHWFGRAGEE